MNPTAARLRAQKAYSTDPEYLERMAVAKETRAAHALRPAPSDSTGADRHRGDCKTGE
jgi:hypothetical protein